MDKQYWKVHILVDLNIIEIRFIGQFLFVPENSCFRTLTGEKLKNQDCHPQPATQPHSTPHATTYTSEHLRTPLHRVVPYDDSTVKSIILAYCKFHPDHFPKIWEPFRFFSV